MTTIKAHVRSPQAGFAPAALRIMANDGQAPEMKSQPVVGRAPGFEVGRAASIRIVCQTVRQLVSEMVALASDRVPLRTDRRRTGCHVRQIAMYVCHVALRLSMTDIGLAFGRDRTTVAYNCGVVEDRRDDAAFDDFVATIERIVTSVFSPAGASDHD